MRKDKIRLYEGVGNGEGSVIGFTPDIASTPAKPELVSFLQANGHTITEIETPGELQHLEGAYYEVVPPIPEDKIRRFATAFLKYADNGRNHVEFVDNRQTIPARHYQTAGEVVNWVG